MPAFAWAVLLGLGTSVATTGDPCVVKRVVRGFFCVPCKRVLKPDDMRFPARTCKRCDSASRSIEFCVKRLPALYRASCHPQKTSSRPFVCDGKLHAVPEIREDQARVTYRCKSCGTAAPFADDLDHKDGCSGSFAVEKVCAKSGREPHVGS